MNTTAGPRKTALTAKEKLHVAFGHLCIGIDQHQLAALYGVNPGRVAEAIDAVRKAIGWEGSKVTSVPMGGDDGFSPDYVRGKRGR